MRIAALYIHIMYWIQVFTMLNLKLVNEFNQPILDAPDYLLQLQISVFDKDNNYFKEAMLQALKLLNEIYFTVLNLVSFFNAKIKCYYGCR